MTTYEEQMLKAQEADKIIFYDYLRYKKAAGWKIRFSDNDWLRPEVIKKARYDANFLRNLPDYYFFGIPINELLKTDYSNGRCHSCVVALSLCFDDFQIVTCNLKNYVDYCNEYSKYKIEDYDHTILLINLDNRKVIIDTTFGFITDIETYNNIFNMDSIRIMFSEEIINTDVYKYIKDRKYKKCPSKKSELEQNEEYQNYIKEVSQYESLCRLYKNEWNPYLQEFISKSLLSNSNIDCFFKWRLLFHVKPDNLHVEYPSKNMNSIEDDEFDITLDNRSFYEETKRRNKRILENYHKETEEVKETKIKKLLSKLFH